MTPEGRMGTRGAGAMTPTLRRCVTTAARLHGVAPGDVLQRTRRAPVVRARDCAIWLARQVGMTGPMIARLLKMDHTSIYAAERRNQERLNDPGR